ncbi:MAG: Xaa-Pro peptidase family protein [Candidatus Zixiibacteriota bacterium]
MIGGHDYRKRAAAIRTWLGKEDLDALITAECAQLQYLIGYTGSNGLLIMGESRADFLTDGRYREQAAREVKGARIHVVSGDLAGHLGRISWLANSRPKLAYCPQQVSEDRIRILRSALPKALFVPVDDPVAPLRQIKDAAELALIRRAAAITDAAFAAVLPVIRPGVRERDVAAELEYTMMKAGSEKTSFETIVASGPRAALPHGRASSRRIRAGDFVTLDFGATYKGYVSDLTRTVVVGRATARQKAVYNLVARAQRAAVARVRSGVVASKLDRVARGIIEKSGHGRRFDHGLGHGIGLVVHEGPAVNAKSNTVLKPGMVVTIEPGVYFPGWGGVRIEDDVLVQARSADVLTSADRTLLEL